jgi:hypothetical protein
VIAVLLAAAVNEIVAVVFVWVLERLVGADVGTP